MMHLPKDYLNDLLVRMAHHSCAIENNNISLSETISILLYKTISKKVSIREFYEIENHRLAFNYIIENMNQELTISLIHDVHSLLMDRLHHERGRFKSQGNAIHGTKFQTATPTDTSLRMNQWLQDLNNQIQQEKTSEDIILSICSSHIEFERIHPYADGNGRTGRLLMMYVLLQNQVLPFVILKEDKDAYFQFLEGQDVRGFAAYANSIVEEETKRYNAFLNSLPKDLKW